MSGRVASGDRRSGFVLVSVLWLGAFLIVLIAALLAQSRGTLAVARAGIDEARADALLTAAVETIASRYIGPSPPKTNDGRMQNLSLAEGSVRFAIQDTNGLVDLNRADPVLINALGDAAGDDRSARTILERRGEPGEKLVNPWRTPAQLADEASVAGSVAGFADSYATVFSTTGAINPLTAPMAVLRLIPGVDADVAAKIMAIRGGAGADPAPVLALFTTGAQYLDPTPSKVFEAFFTATVKGGLTKTARATMLFDGGGSVPYRILEWHPWAVQPAWAGRGSL